MLVFTYSTSSLFSTAKGKSCADTANSRQGVVAQGSAPAVLVRKIFLKASLDKFGAPSARQAVLESLTCICGSHTTLFPVNSAREFCKTRA